MPRVKITQRNLLKFKDQEYLLDHGKILLSETIAVERATQMTWPQVLAALQVGMSTAVRAVVWVLQKRSNPKLQITAVECSMEEYELQDPDYMQEYWVPAGDDEPDYAVHDLTDDGEERPQDVVPDEDSEPEGPKEPAPLPPATEG